MDSEFYEQDVAPEEPKPPAKEPSPWPWFLGGALILGIAYLFTKKD